MKTLCIQGVGIQTTKQAIKDFFGNILHTCIAKVDGIILYQVGSLSILKDGPMITYGEI